MFRKGRFLVTWLMVVIFFFLQTMPISAYDVAKTIGPIDIQGAKITIQFINNWSDKVIEEALNLEKSGQVDAVAWYYTGYISKFCGKDVVHFGAAMYYNLCQCSPASTPPMFT